jgi:hypothetical protein
MKLTTSFLAGLCVLGLLSGCATTKDAAEEKTEEKKVLTPTEYLEKLKPNLIEITANAEAKKFAETHADNFFNALKNRDYETFSKSKKLTKESFEKWCEAITKTYGELQSMSYVGVKENPYILRYMWKWDFQKKDMGTTFNRQILYNVFIIKYKNKANYDLFFVGPQ